MKYKAYIRIYKDDIEVPDIFIAGIVARKARKRLEVIRDKAKDSVIFIIGQAEGKQGPNTSIGDPKLIEKYDALVKSTIQEIIDEADAQSK